MKNADILHSVLHTLLPQLEADLNEFGFFAASGGWVKPGLELEAWRLPDEDIDDEALVPVIRKETGQTVHLNGRVATWLCYSALAGEDENESAVIEIKIVGEKFRYYYYYPFSFENEKVQWGTPYAEKVPLK